MPVMQFAISSCTKLMILPVKLLRTSPRFISVCFLTYRNVYLLPNVRFTLATVVVTAVAFTVITYSLTRQIDYRYQNYHWCAYVFLIIAVEVSWFLYFTSVDAMTRRHWITNVAVLFCAWVVTTFSDILTRQFGKPCANIDIHRVFSVQAARQRTHLATYQVAIVMSQQPVPGVVPGHQNADPPVVAPVSIPVGVCTHPDATAPDLPREPPKKPFRRGNS